MGVLKHGCPHPIVPDSLVIGDRVVCAPCHVVQAAQRYVETSRGQQSGDRRYTRRDVNVSYLALVNAVVAYGRRHGGERGDDTASGQRGPAGELLGARRAPGQDPRDALDVAGAARAQVVARRRDGSADRE